MTFGIQVFGVHDDIWYSNVRSDEIRNLKVWSDDIWYSNVWKNYIRNQMLGVMTFGIQVFGVTTIGI